MPTVSNVQKNGFEDTPLLLTVADFAAGFSSPSSLPILNIQIVTLPTNGSLFYGDYRIQAGDQFTTRGITALGGLTFVPNENFAGVTSFTWTAADDDDGVNDAPAPATFSLVMTNVNDIPADILLNPSSVNENSPIGTTVGTLSTVDPDTGNTFTYSLFANEEYQDNQFFEIVGNQLRLRVSPNREERQEYRIYIRTTDQDGEVFDKQFDITVADVNEAPTGLQLSNSRINENLGANALVGLFSTTDPDEIDQFTYALVSGAGSIDNSAFAIVNNQLQLRSNGDFETKQSYSIRVRSTDKGRLFTEQTFTINLSNVNDAPSDIFLNNSRINENIPVNSVVGTLRAIDQDAGSSVGLSLVNGVGGADNSRFRLLGNQLLIKESPNFEAKSSYSIRVRATDNFGATFDKVLTIGVNDRNDAPRANLKIPDRVVALNSPLIFQIPVNAFVDEDRGDRLTYSISQTNGQPLPDWLKFDPATRRFTGTPSEADVQKLSLRVIARDDDGAAAAQNFDLLVGFYSAQQAKQGLYRGLEELQKIYEQRMLNVSLPVAGTLKDEAPAFITVINQRLQQAIGNTQNFTLNQFRSIVENSLRPVFGRNLQVTTERTSSDEVILRLNVGQNASRSVGLLRNLGLNALKLETTSRATASFDKDLSLVMGFNRRHGFFIDTQKSRLDSKVSLNTNGLNVKANLGFLQANFGNNSRSRTSLDTEFRATLRDLGGANDGDGDRLTTRELNGNFQTGSLFSTRLAVHPNIGLSGRTSFGRSIPLPSYKFNLNAGWQRYEIVNGRVGNAPPPKLEVQDVQMDLGSFVNRFARPIINTINDVVGPFRPVTQFLTRDTRLFSAIGLRNVFDQNRDGIVNVLEVAGTIAGRNLSAATSFINTLNGIAQADRALDNLGSSADGDSGITINHGTFLIDDIDPTKEQQTRRPRGRRTGTAPQSSLAQANARANQRTKDVLNAFSNLGALRFPILENPESVIGLILGSGDVSLFNYDLPDLALSFGVRRDFKIKPPVAGFLSGDISLNTNLSFGYDTTGLQRWRDSNYSSATANKLFDGFYVVDNPGNELEIVATIQVGAGLNFKLVRGYVKGGIEGRIGIDLVDVGEAQGTSDRKIRGSEFSSRPIQQQFNINGNVSIFLGAEVQIWLPFKYRTVWDRRFATFQLASFSVGASNGGNTSRKYISGATIYLDSNFNGVQDDFEPFTISNPDSSYNLEIPLYRFDTNSNSVIDPSEGRLVSIGGTDTFTLLEVETPLYAPAGYRMITPVTTLIQDLLRLGVAPDVAVNQVRTALGLPAVDLASFDSIAAINSGDVNGAAVMSAHIQVQNLIDLSTRMVRGVLNQPAGTIADRVIRAIATQIQATAGSLVDLTDTATIQTILSATLTSLTPTSPDTNWLRLLDIVDEAATIIAGGNARTRDIFRDLPLADTLVAASELQTTLLSNTADDLQAAAAGNQPIDAVVNRNTGDALLQTVAAVRAEKLPNPISGTNSNDVIVGTAGRDGISGFNGNDRLFGLAGEDLLAGGAGDDILRGGTEADILYGGLGRDRLFGEQGNDALLGEQGNDILIGGDGDDIMDGGAGNDIAWGGNGNDLISGDVGNDTLRGENGNDILRGDAGRDILIGGVGNDLLNGGAGVDRLTGGAGRDTFVLEAPLTGVDIITDFVTRSDIIQVNANDFRGNFTAGRAITAAQFQTGTGARDASDRFIYDRATGRLFFDIDGTGARAQIQIAQLSAGLALTNRHIVVGL